MKIIQGSYQILVVGSEGCGSSSFLHCFYSGHWVEQVPRIVATESYRKILMINGDYIALDILDIIGQEKDRGQVALFRKNIDGIMVVYDITNARSFISAQKWAYSWGAFQKSVPLLLVGTKNDLDSNREVTTLQGQSFADSISMMFVEVSSKKTDDVNKAFEFLASRLIICKPEKRHNYKQPYHCIVA